jgi:hypothetical protein
MALVLLSAVGLAALRNANERWATVMTLLAVALIGIAVLWSILLRGPERAWWLGFAVLGIAYPLVSQSPVRSWLGTTRLLEYVHAKVADLPIASFDVSRFDGNSLIYRVVTTDGEITEKTVANSAYDSVPAEDILVSMLPANRWRSSLPGAANAVAFLRVGHALFALLAGLIGGTVAAWIYVRRERAEKARFRTSLV